MKITDHYHSNKYITTQRFNKLTVENFEARLAQAKLTTKADIAEINHEPTMFNFANDKVILKLTTLS